MANGTSSRTRVMAITLMCTSAITAVLIAAIATQGVTARTVTAGLLIMSFAVFIICGMLFSGRAFLNWPITDMTAFMRWERGTNIAAVVLTMLGLVLLADLLRSAGDAYFGLLGAAGYLFGAVLIVVAETDLLGKQEWNDVQVKTYVMVAFVAQVAVGAALLQTGIVAAWASWVTIVWNAGLALIMIVLRPREMYYPALHYVAPVAIGIALLASAG